MSYYSSHLQLKMTFTQLNIFSKLAELQNFTKTADELQISQSAISHAIKTLEKEWNIQLFYRNQNDIKLTEHGLKLLIKTREILNLNQGLHQEIDEIHGIHHGTLRIGSFGTSSSIILIPLILELYKQRYPNIEIYIEEGNDQDISTWLVNRKIDIGFVVLPDDRFDTIHIMDDIFVALIPKHYELASKKAIELSDLVPYPFLMTGAGSQRHVANMFKKLGLAPNIKCNFSQLLTIINMVNSGTGVSVVADMALNKDLLNLYPNIVKRPLKPNIKRSIGLAVKNKAHVTPATQAFIDIALEVLKDQ